MWTLGGHHFGKSYFCGRPYFESNGHEARSSCIRKPTSRRKKPRRDTVVPEENNRTNAPRKLINKPVKLTQSAEIDISNPQLEGSCLSEKAKPRDKYCERDCLRIYESGRDSREKHSASDIAFSKGWGMAIRRSVAAVSRPHNFHALSKTCDGFA